MVLRLHLLQLEFTVLRVRDAKIFDYRHYLEQAAFTDRVAGLQRASADMWVMDCYSQILG